MYQGENVTVDPPSKCGASKYVWIFVDSLLFLVIVSGNILTILAIAWSRKLRHVISNYFILNLAVSDLLVGITLPYHLAFYVNCKLHQDKTICLSRIVIISMACGESICNLIAIAIDRYIAIVHPLSYNAYATKKRVMLFIAISWACVVGVTSMPICWNCFNTSLKQCELDTILPREYTMYILLPSFCLSWIAMFLLYWKIWREAHMHTRRMNLSVIPHVAEKTDRKSIQVVLLILGCFSICWLPYWVVVCIKFYEETVQTDVYNITFALALANSGMNPFIYAWKSTNFRKAFQKILRFKSPNENLNASFKMYLEKQRELKDQQTNVAENCINGNVQGHSSDCQFNLTEENTIL
ncbi:histamine H2 receptor isoform X2 [Nylanderia fulva]|nr:histamine H2 receptor isoform X2 [Nylanderia fulva]XP_029174089.1 histamine H2 receptor isoform X2 [Nylanderia fulva]